MNYLSAVDDCFIDTPGGMARVAWDVALVMRERGHNVTIFCAQVSSQSAAASLDEADGIRIVRYDRPVLTRWHPRRADRLIASAAVAARSYLGNEKWDVIHMHSPFTGMGVIDGLVCGPRLVYTMHSPILLEQQINWAHQGIAGKIKWLLGRGALKRIEGGLLRRCDSIQTLSQYTHEQIEKSYGLGSRVTVIPHWPSPAEDRVHSKAEARRLLGWPVDEPILFTIRRHGARYGLDVAIQAIAPLAAEKRCLFVVGGDGPMRPALRQLAAELNAGDRVLFPGRLSDDHLRLAYQAADLFVLPTLALECFGLITIEAFAYGCPVVSTDVGAIPETMQPILPNMIVPAGDVKALRRKVEEFFNGRLELPSPDALTQYVDDNFGKDVVTPRILDFLECDIAVTKI